MGEWVSVAPALAHKKLPLCLKDEILEIASLCWKGGKLPAQVKSHAWTLFQRRLSARFCACPWCGKEKDKSVAGDVNFMHEAWSCPLFRSHWNNLRPAAKVPNLTSITEIALGADPQRPHKLVKKEHRIRALLLHAAMWAHRPQYEGTNTIDYKSTLSTFFVYWQKAKLLAEGEKAIKPKCKSVHAP